jgi:GNAT superfamily N-acetyltransferase
MTPPNSFHIRPARPTDRDAVFAMVRTIWGGNDYVPEVWDEWLADASGPLLVGELAGRPVALTKLSAIGPGEDWFHGTRVDPEYRGRGFAKALLQHCVELSRERGARTLRYLTDEDNTPMHRAGEAAGFRLVYAPAWYHAPATDGAPEAVALPPERLAALLDDLGRSPLLAQTGGMYSYGWRNLDLTAARLREHLARGEVLGLPGDTTWAIVVPRDEGGIWLAHVEGAGTMLERLIKAVLASAEPFDRRYARALLPPEAACIPALLAAGFEEDEDHMRVYELRC